MIKLKSLLKEDIISTILINVAVTAGKGLVADLV